jgi:hypothetical protein
LPGRGALQHQISLDYHFHLSYVISSARAVQSYCQPPEHQQLAQHQQLPAPAASGSSTRGSISLTQSTIRVAANRCPVLRAFFDAMQSSKTRGCWTAGTASWSVESLQTLTSCLRATARARW